MKTNKQFIKIDSIDAYNKLYGLQTHHPLVTVINLNNATRIVNNVKMDYGVYALYLKNGDGCTIKYGRQPYDYQEGTIVSFSPGQLVGVETEVDEVAPDVIGLMFHPDLIYGTPLAVKIRDYNFFDYSQREALHLSVDERKMFVECLERIETEISRPIDRHTSEIVASHIQLMLDYMSRFYERQFITRRKVNSDIVSRFESELKDFFTDSRNRDGLPTVNYFANLVNLTPGYFGDLVKRETGMTAQEMITLRMIDNAKLRLSTTNDDISIIAYDFGFQHPQHFSRMFKRQTGLSPKEWRIRN